MHLVQDSPSRQPSLRGGGLRLPTGTLLTPRAFQLLGLSGLGSGGQQSGNVRGWLMWGGGAGGGGGAWCVAQLGETPQNGGVHIMHTLQA